MFEVHRALADNSETGTRQREIAAWFDATYREKGLRYLRPAEAYDVFPALLEGVPGQSLLDIACGPGLLLERAALRGLHIAGVDISAVALSAAAKRLPDARLSVASAERLPYRDAEFDRVSCVGSLERFLSAEAALSEMRRVIRDIGVLVLMVRNSRSLQWLLLSGLGLRNEQGNQGADTLERWQQRIESNGFRVREVYPDQWPLMRWQRLKPRLLGPGDFSSLRNGVLPLRYANEFIFVCSPV